jgi:hypothetical protein
MQDQVDELRAEVAALRDELAEARAERGQAITRRRLLTAVAGLGAAGAAGVVTASPASAADDDPLTIGADNTGETETTLRRGTVAELPGLPITDSATLRIESEDGLGLVVAAPGGVRIASEDGLHSTGWTGIVGESDALVGVGGIGHDAIGVYAESDTSTALYIKSTEGPHIGIIPGEAEGPPEFWGQEKGAIRMDSNAELWLCVAVAQGGAGTWTRLLREDTAPGRVIPITPFRAIDTRATAGRASGAPVVPGQRKGPLKGGESVTLDLAGVDPIPATASGVIGTANILSPDGNGYLRIMPAGASAPAASFSWQDGINNANGFTSGLSDTGLRAVAPVSSTVRYHLVIDIAAYIT